MDRLMKQCLWMKVIHVPSRMRTHFVLMGNYLFLCSEFLLVLSDSMQYTLTKEDVGRHLKFVYTPVNLEGLLNSQALAMTYPLLVCKNIILH